MLPERESLAWLAAAGVSVVQVDRASSPDEAIDRLCAEAHVLHLLCAPLLDNGLALPAAHRNALAAVSRLK